MKTSPASKALKSVPLIVHRFVFGMPRAALGALAFAAMAAVTGCEAPTAVQSGSDEQHAELTLREGDVVKVSFPGAPNLDVAPQPIRRDGKITLPIVGEIAVVGLTPIALQDQLVKRLADQLQSKEVVVTVVSSSFFVFVDGMVLRPGKIVTDHPITILEAVMEAGGFDYSRADSEKVMVIRHKTGSIGYDYITINLKQVFDGRRTDLFYLAPDDVVHVPQKFSWY
jgi:polysaccharide export outer membrane protein